jgi:hypothetical protein
MLSKDEVESAGMLAMSMQYADALNDPIQRALFSLLCRTDIVWRRYEAEERGIVLPERFSPNFGI